jgi:hypothetical protein
MFRPDPRVGDRQRACSSKDCQCRRRARTQADWRSRNASYQADYRLKKRATKAAAAERGEKADDRPITPPPPLRLAPELTSFPWDHARTELGFAGAELMATLALTLVRLVKDMRDAQDAKDERLAEKPFPMRDCAPAGRDP